VWQFRAGDFRVFYDVDEERRKIIVRAIRRKGTTTTRE
jgi:mRNA-degrading endonuclease RelE of RelBE toxin-antitoxin system